MTVAQVLQQAKALTPNQRKELLKLLNELIEGDAPKPKRSLRELVGLGKEYWEGIDADAYVNELRDEWDQDR